MNDLIFNGEQYNDDRMYVLALSKCTMKEDAEIIETIIHYEDIPSNFIWCVVTYRNVKRYRATRVDPFNSKNEAKSYFEHVEPQTPLVSLGGRSPINPLPYEKYIEWKQANNFKEYDYQKMFKTGGSKPQEILLQQK
ncbi:hypothetical protein [Desulfobacula sp.]|jgi:hypothetical protein|uniref:hypothetical protein n=1 Tax=Desulfobacula sp. TaxID=2593537 RepID=UPI001ED21907|nr:hypothetical protein [Desulfobacula sp.]MBT4199274.1 hypothetical protein [Desulfobacula sp.]MBT5527936.1 hypothetical protein [Cytophagia bacterium]